MRGENTVLDAPSVTATRKAMLTLVDRVEDKLQRPVYRELIVLRMPIQLCIDRDAKRKLDKGEEPYPEDLYTRHIVHFEKGLTEIGMEGWDAINFIYTKDLDG
jgi:hypothetical protein